MGSAPRCPSRLGGIPGTGGPGRAGTAAAGEQPPAWTERREEEEEEEEGAQRLQVAGERVEVIAEGLHVDGVQGWREGAPSLADRSV